MHSQPMEHTDSQELTILSNPCSQVQFKQFKIGFKQKDQKHYRKITQNPII